MQDTSLNLRPGEMVEVRSPQEIGATLDAGGALEALPFMPEMREFCGRRFRVFRRADRTCIDGLGLVRMKDAVFLEEVRCDGAAHAGCDRGCLVFWKEAWLRRIEPTAAPSPAGPPVRAPVTSADTSVRCQSTELVRATSRLPTWHLGQYFDALRGENVSLRHLAYSLFITGRDLVRHRWLSGARYAAVPGALRRTPTESLNLQPGEDVRVKSADEIRATLDAAGKNRGLMFTKEMLAFCDQVHRVRSRVERMVNELTGAVVPMTHTVILDRVTCNGCSMRACPRDSFHYWREIWLRRA